MIRKKSAVISTENQNRYDDFISKNAFITRTLKKLNWTESHDKKKLTAPDPKWLQQMPAEITSENLLLHSELSLEKNAQDKVTAAYNARVFYVKTRKEDGNSWLAEKLRRNLTLERGGDASNYSDLTFSQYRASNSFFDTLKDIAPPKRILKLATTAGLIAKKPFHLRHSQEISALFALIVVEVLKSRLSGLMQSIHEHGLQMVIYGIELLLAGLVYVSVTKFKQKQSARENSDPDVNASLENALREKSGTPEYRTFIKVMAEDLRNGEFPRVVLVDNFRTLHFTLKEIIFTYILGLHERASDRELWILFENEGDSELETFLNLNTRVVQLYTSKWKLQSLTQKEKELLKERLKLPSEVLKYSTLKRITQNESDLDKYITSMQERCNSGSKEKFVPAYRLLHLMALNAQYLNEFINSETFIQLLSDKNIRYNVLLKFLGLNSISRPELSALLKTLYEIDEKERILEFSEKSNAWNKVIRPSSETIDVLGESDYQCIGSMSRYGHLYLAMFWMDRRATDRNRSIDKAWLLKILYHLNQIQAPDFADQQIALQVYERIIEIYIFVLEKSIAFCHFERDPLQAKLIQNEIVSSAKEICNFLNKDTRQSALKKIFRLAQTVFAITNDIETARLLMEIEEDILVPQENEISNEHAYLQSDWMQRALNHNFGGRTKGIPENTKRFLSKGNPSFLKHLALQYARPLALYRVRTGFEADTDFNKEELLALNQVVTIINSFHEPYEENNWLDILNATQAVELLRDMLLINKSDIHGGFILDSTEIILKWSQNIKGRFSESISNGMGKDFLFSVAFSELRSMLWKHILACSNSAFYISQKEKFNGVMDLFIANFHDSEYIEFEYGLFANLQMIDSGLAMLWEEFHCPLRSEISNFNAVFTDILYFYLSQNVSSLSSEKTDTIETYLTEFSIPAIYHNLSLSSLFSFRERLALDYHLEFLKHLEQAGLESEQKTKYILDVFSLYNLDNEYAEKNYSRSSELFSLKGNRTFYEYYLDQRNQDTAFHVSRFLRSVFALTDERLRLEYLSKINNYIDGMKEGVEKQKLKNQIKFGNDRQEILKGNADLQKILLSWGEIMDSEYYPSIVESYIEKLGIESVIDQLPKMFSSGLDTDKFTFKCHLGAKLLMEFKSKLSADLVKIILFYLENRFWYLSSVMDADTALIVLEVLEAHSPNDTRIQPKIEEIQFAILQHEKHYLRKLFNEKMFYQNYKYLVRLFRQNLTFDIPRNEFIGFLDGQIDIHLNAAELYISTGEIPSWCNQTTDGIQICTQFISIGEGLNHVNNLKDDDTRFPRGHFELACFDALRGLQHVLLSQGNLSTELSKLIQTMQNYLTDFVHDELQD